MVVATVVVICQQQLDFLQAVANGNAWDHEGAHQAEHAGEVPED